MIQFPFKRVFGLVGAPRAGKDSVAQFLRETRGFEARAFADKIKEDFGISKEEFEAAKIAGNIEKLRDKLWAFSADKKQNDPLYFINLVVKDSLAIEKSVVITDIRTPEEFSAVKNIGRIYWVSRDFTSDYEEKDSTRYLSGSKLLFDELTDGLQCGNIRGIGNRSGLVDFLKDLEKIFFMEDIMDLSDSPSDTYKDNNKRRAMMSFMNQFNINT